MAERGPVVIDWANAGWGNPDVDVALTWVILHTSSGELGRRLAAAFARYADTVRGRDAAARLHPKDLHLTPTERQAVRRLLPDPRA